MGRLKDVLSEWDTLGRIRPYLPPLNFITIHYLYFIGTCIVTSVIFYCTSTPPFSITYTDSLFMVVSAITEAGLNTVNLSQMNTFQQWLLWMHIIAGSTIFVSIFIIHVRKRAFEKRFGALLKSQTIELRKQRKSFKNPSRSRQTSFSRPDGAELSGERPTANRQPGRADQEQKREIGQSKGQSVEADTTAITPLPPGDPDESAAASTINVGQTGTDHITFLSYAPFKTGDFTTRKRRSSDIFSFTGVGASPTTTLYRRPNSGMSLNERIRTIPAQSRDTAGETVLPLNFGSFLSKDVIGRNSQFHGLTYEEREQLGGVEYRAITLLSWVVPVYFVLWQLLSCLSLGAWMASSASEITRANGINPWWNGAFNAVSAFNNSGMSLLDANMIPFQTSTYPVLTMGLLILAGNTAYPVFLRLILWTMYRLLPNRPRYCVWRDTLKFALDHPRRIYTNLFPSTATWWLMLMLIILNGTDWVIFELLNMHNSVVTSIPGGARALDGLFQALAVRSGGFYIVPISSLRIGVQVLYVLMMYISVYPVVITMRNSNVYEERSLGIYADDPEEQQRANDPELGAIDRLRRRMRFRVFANTSETRSYFIRQQVRGQLAHDLYWLCIAVLLIVCIETASFLRDPITYSVFNVVFEVVSGYGCVGITTGLPDQAYSFSGGWHVVSKLILCAVMLRGRHRGLPVAIDRAVLLPGEGLTSREEEDHDIRRGRSREVGGRA